MWTVEELEKVRDIETELQKLCPDLEVTEVIGNMKPVAVKTLVKEKGNKKLIEALVESGWKKGKRKMVQGAYCISMRKML